MINRQEEIRKKGFSMTTPNDSTYVRPHDVPNDFSKIKVGVKTLEDAIINIGDFKKANPRLADKKEVLRVMEQNDFRAMREISNFFYKTSGIYSRLCRYMAYLYRYDWMVTPYINSESLKTNKILDGYNKVLTFFDNFGVQQFCGEVALKVLRNGCYYGYVIKTDSGVSIQELPPNYCRSRYTVGNKPAIELNMKFFDEQYSSTTRRMQVLKLFPKEIQKGYVFYKEGKLPAEFQGDTSGWYLLDLNCAIKFNLNGEDTPSFFAVIPSIIDLDNAQELDRKKMAQKLIKLIVQKMPIDKNGDLVFDVDEAQALHNNVVRMVADAIGVNVLTTFADVAVEDMADNSTTTTVDELEKVERTVYNEAGVSQMQFNTDGNLALQKSILNDEATMYNLLLQFESFLNGLLSDFNKSPKKMYYKIELLPTTINNYTEMSNYYKEQMQLGHSKMLPLIALGQSQSSILANAYFENRVLNLSSILIPPLSSNTMSADALNSDGDVGAPALKDEDKAEKTIQNEESMS